MQQKISKKKSISKGKTLKKIGLTIQSNGMESSTKSVKPKIIEAPKLLLQYKYDLIGSDSKYISIGYSTEPEFKTTVIIFKNEKSFIVLHPSSWKVISSFAREHIDKYFAEKDKNGMKKRIIVNSPSIKVSKMQSNDEFLIKIESIDGKYANKSVTLNEVEWKNCLDLSDYFEDVVEYYNKNCSNIEMYYQNYMVNCVLKGKMKLDKNDFFLPNKPANYNVFRLFYEIPIICENKLKLDLNELVKQTSVGETYIPNSETYDFDSNANDFENV